ncbi:hypothetical protein [Marinicella gelatinilytica]|uniref:hypothetical protein n=1 Tax=Marinicella gelatinilytica TaxID=2996017 RepID=UPI002260B898|nr:hypothetical protein [Marinicella gelatinilytica]MCX7544921.1 hypothetical protein [Marinicella gelatinilytica]
MVRIIIGLTMMVMLSACGPKSSYLNPDIEKPGFNRIAVVLDYVYFVDGVDHVMDYDANKNQTQIRRLKEDIEHMLKAKNFAVEWALVTSGVGLHPDMPFAHYQDGERQVDIIYPPFYIDSHYPFDVQDQLMASFMDAQRVALTSASKNNQHYLQRLRLKTIDLRQSMSAPNIANPAGILHVRVLAPRTSFLKTLGSGSVSVGISTGSVRGSHVGIGLPLTSGNKSLTTAVLFDNGNGRVVWKNQRNGDLSRLSNDATRQFFKNFPFKP